MRSVFVAIFALLPSMIHAQENSDVTVLSYNIYWGGTSTDAPLEQTAEAIRSSGASIVGIQEKEAWDDRGEPFYRNNAQALAELLDWDFANQRVIIDGTWNDVAILSEHPIKALTEKELCALIDVAAQEIVFCNIHLYSAPYQPYQLSNIDYRDAPFLTTEEGAIAYANQVRGNGIDVLLEELSSLDGDPPIIVVGDFNEPSHLDWTEAAAEAGLHPIKVAYPQSMKMAESDFIDVYRAAHPDEVSDPGFTWTPTTQGKFEGRPPRPYRLHLHQRCRSVRCEGYGRKARARGSRCDSLAVGSSGRRFNDPS